MRRLIMLSVTVLTAVVLAACGDDGGGGSTASTGTVATEPAATGSTAARTQFNDADVTFAQGMIPHHEQAIEMSETALDPKAAASAKVKDLATRIKKAQDPEITMMRGWLKTWGKGEMTSDMAGHSMTGMMTDTDMKKLATATGTQYDKLWAEMMITHHKGAIEMANTEKKAGKNAEALKTADQIIISQTAEITELQALTK